MATATGKPIAGPTAPKGPTAPPIYGGGTPATTPTQVTGTPATGGTQINNNNSALAALTGDQRNAYSALVDVFNSYGLGSLAPSILTYVQQGFNSDTITLMLQQTDAYKQRFAGNIQRQKNGMAVLSPADYIATENSYREAMRAAGLPASFYNSPSDFANYIGNDVSPTEMNNRIQLASQATLTASPQYTQALKQMGLSQGDLTAYFLDPTKALPILQQQTLTAQIGSEALVRGLNFDRGYAQQLAQAGFTQSQAAQGYGQIAGEIGALQNAARSVGQNYTFGQEEQAVFQPGAGGNELLRQRLQGVQQGLTSGSLGGASSGLTRFGGGGELS